MHNPLSHDGAVCAADDMTVSSQSHDLLSTDSTTVKTRGYNWDASDTGVCKNKAEVNTMQSQQHDNSRAPS